MLARNALLVDDSKSARFVLGKLLQQHDFNVEMVASAEDALEFLATHKPDAIFMDHLMKGMDGLVATSVIKKNPATAHIPIVMCTSNDGEQYRAEAKLHGALGTLVKPPSDDKLEEILIAINKAIDNNKSTSEAFRIRPVARAETSSSTSSDKTPAPTNILTEAQIQSIVSSSINARTALIEQSLEAELKRQRDEFIELLDSKLTEKSDILSNKQEIQGLLDEGLAKINESITGQITELRQELADEIVGSAKLFRQVQEIAAETSASLVEEKVKAIAGKFTSSTSSSAFETAVSALEADISKKLIQVEQAAKKQAFTYSILSALAGAGAAIVLFLLVL